MTPADLMEILERIESHLVWQTEALKHLLVSDTGIELTEADELTDWLAEAPLTTYPVDDMADQEHIAVRHRPQPKTAPCPHRQQVVVQGRLACAVCGYVFGDTGMVRNSVGPSGQVVLDPNPPKWSTEQSRGASSKNPGGALVPHSD